MQCTASQAKRRTALHSCGCGFNALAPPDCNTVKHCDAGKWWAYQHDSDPSIRPDMLLFAKGIGSGFPTGGVAMEAALLERMPTGVLGGTYGGGSMAHAAMHATIGVIEGEQLAENAAARGAQLVQGLREIKGRHAWPIRDVRGRGLMAAIEFDADAGTAAQARGLCSMPSLYNELQLRRRRC
jgi:4-aminobutyrate aminotransferase-like enzyme